MNYQCIAVREVECRQALMRIIMPHSRSTLNAELNDRVFTNISVEDCFEAFYADPDFDEVYAEQYALLFPISALPVLQIRVCEIYVRERNENYNSRKN